jgi:uncharacterized membrane protein
VSVPTSEKGPNQAPRRGWTDERVEQIIGNLLRAGVVVSALVVGLGGGLYLTHEGTRPAQEHHVFKGEPQQLRRPLDILRDAGHGNSDAIIACGLLLLIATPIARVLFSVLAFATQRDRTYVVITLIVLGVLLYSLFSGHLH